MGAICEGITALTGGLGSGLCQAAGSAADGVENSVMANIASTFQTAEVNALQALMTWWVPVSNAGDPSATTSADVQSLAGPVAYLQANTMYLTGFAAVLGLLVAAARLAWERRAEPARQILHALVTLAIVCGGASAGVTLALAAGDSYSSWILENTMAKGTTFSSNAQALVSLSSATLDSGLMIVLGLLGVIAALVQLVLMLVRTAMCSLLTGLLPLGAALGTMESGKGMFKKMLGWLVAFVLYKPVAATIYAYCFYSMKQGDAADQLSGMVMLVLAVAALPALMRFVVPMVAAAGGSGGAGAAIGGAASATGARMMSTGRSGSGGGTQLSAPSTLNSPGVSAPSGSAQATAPPGSTRSPSGAPAAPGADGGPGVGAAAGAGSAGGGAAASAAAGPVGMAAAAAQQAGKAAKGAAENGGMG